MTLIIALISLVVLSALGTSLMMVTGTEVRAAANYAANAAKRVCGGRCTSIASRELLAVSDWQALLSSGALSGFVDGVPSGVRQLGDGSTVDLAQATSLANGEPRPWGANNPVWRLFAFGRVGQRTYVIAWVGDDSAENDGDPLTDGGGESNPGAGILAVRAEAFGVGGAHTVLEATIRQDAESSGIPMVRMLSWHEIR